MKTASVRDLRNQYTNVLRWISAGEEVLITRRGRPIARLVPEKGQSLATVDWSKSPAVNRDRSGARVLTAAKSRELVHDAGGKW
jgi:prevent-host-death family protein